MKRIIIACCLGILLLSSNVWGFNYEEKFHQTFNIPKGGSLSLTNPTGNVKITKWNRDQVDVLAIKRSSRSKADLKRVRIEVVQGKSMVIRSIYEWNASAGVDYEIKVPAGVRLAQIENTTGNLEINDVGECDTVKVITGNLTVRSASGPLKAETVTGNLFIYLKQINRNANFSVITGQLNVYFNPKINASLDASVTTGSIANLLLTEAEESGGLVSKHLRGVLGKGGAKIEVKVVTGGIGLYKL